MLSHRMAGMFAVLLMTVPLMGQGLDFQENWESYDPVRVDPPWVGDNLWELSSNAGGSFWVEPRFGRDSDRGILVNNKGYNGRDFGVTSLLGGGVEWDGSDDCPLVLEYYVYHGSIRQQAEADYYVELSKGDVHAPPPGTPPLESAIDCVAYCKPWGSGDFAKKRIFVFNGKQWIAAGWPSTGWNRVSMTIKSNTLLLYQYSTNEVAREHMGKFDRISIYTTNFWRSGWTSIDDVSVTGGFITVTASLDILPNDYPNYFTPNKKSKGRLPMAILGSVDLDVTTIDFSTANIAGIYPVKDKATYKDVNLDGYLDLEFKFSRGALIDALGLDMYEPGDVADVTVNAKLGCDGLVATDTLVIQD